MRRIPGMLAAAGSALILCTTAIAAEIDPQRDLETFQRYFKDRFPDVAFDEYANGIYGLAVAARQRAEWEQIEEFPPYELELESGRQFWEEQRLAECFRNGGRGIAQNYPYWDAGQQAVRTIEMDINDCLRRQGGKPIADLKKGTMAQVVAYFKSMSRGNRVSPAVDWSDPGALREYALGREFFWAKRGQLNFSCANCHIHSAGLRIGGNVLSPALGHGVGFPTYRSKWGSLGTLHRRYGGCNQQVRAAPLKAQSREYRALELYETFMSTGLPLTAPSQRP